jgi:ATP/maltotriose-dependent transcriptional regulator MalT
MFFYASRTLSAGAAVERVQRVIGDTDEWPEATEPLVDAARAGVLLLAGDVTQACAVAERVLTYRGAPAVAQLRAILVAGPGAAIAGRTTEALAFAAHGLELLERGTAGTSAATDALVELDAEPLVLATCSLANRLAGRLHKSRAIAEEGYRRAIAQRSSPAHGLFALAIAHISLSEGRIDQAARRAREAVTLLRRPPALYLVWALGYLGQASALLGDLATAEAALAEAEEQRSSTFQIFDCDVRQAEAWIHALRGDGDAARRTALDAAMTAATAGQLAFAAHAAHDAARLGAVLPAARMLGEFATCVDGPLVPLFARHAEALARRDTHELMACADAFATLGAGLAAAEAAAVASHVFERSGDQRRAKTAGARAATWARPAGPVVSPALVALVRAPVLSDREEEIARLAAAGMSNRAIAARLHISVRTVDNHLHHAYEKLGITGRDELAANLR